MESREQRITTLATTLRSSGIAKSDSQARMMAEDMIGVEEHVQRDFEVEHKRAHEYLQTTKNLGAPRQTIKPEPKVETNLDTKAESKQEPSRKIEELYTSRADRPAKREPNPEFTDVNFGGKTLNQAVAYDAHHDTHNSALESIKAQVSSQKIIPLEDRETENIEPKSNVVFEPELEPKSEPVVSAKLDEIKIQDDIVKDKSVIYEVDDLVNVPLQTDKEESKEVFKEDIKEEPKADFKEAFKEEPKIEVKEDSKEKETVVETPKEEPKLDAQKLIDMMEEDGKLEEHTREIKEKPKDVKPKEAYEENNIDLGNVFNFGKK